MIKFVPALLGLLILGLLGGWTLFVALARLTGAHVSWWRPRFGTIPRADLFDLVRSTATMAALVAGLFAILYAYRKQRVEEAAGYRADAEALAKRYQDAAEQMGHERAAVRLAGVYAMVRLADDWAEQRQTCVDVLCAYLRIPPSLLEGGGVDVGEAEVRRTIQRAIASHVSDGYVEVDAFDDPPPPQPMAWSALTYDFSGATLVDVDFRRAYFSQTVSFQSVCLRGTCSFDSAVFMTDANFDRVSIDGRVDMRATVVEKRIRMVDAVVSSAGAIIVELKSNKGLDIINMVVDGLLAMYMVSTKNSSPPGSTFRIFDTSRLEGVQLRRGSVALLGGEASPQPATKVYASNWTLEGGARAVVGKSLLDAGVLEWVNHRKDSADDLELRSEFGIFDYLDEIVRVLRRPTAADELDQADL